MAALYGALFLSAFLAATILPVSSEVVLAGMVASGRGDPALLLVVATIGNTLGSVVNWFLGRGVDTLRTSPWFPVTPERYEQTSRTFRRFGAWTPLLQLVDCGSETCAEVQRRTEPHLAEVRAKIADLQRIETILATTIVQCSGDDVPECPILDALAA